MPEQTTGTSYLTTLQGICKIVEVIASLIAILLVAINFQGDRINVFVSASVISIVGALIFLILYISGAVAKISWPWNKIQFFFHVILAIYYIIGSGLILDYAEYDDRLLAGGIFGLIAVVAHLIDAIDNYRKDPLR